MEKEFIPYEQALALKKLGFDELCFKKHFKDKNGVEVDGSECSNTSIKKFYNYRNNHCAAPIYQQAFRWFREKYKLDTFVKRDYKDTISIGYYYGIDGSTKDTYSKNYKTYEEAELECLKKLIEIAQVKGFPEQDN